MKKWILIANEEQGKIFQKSSTNGLSYVGSVRERQDFVKSMASFINDNTNRFQFLTIIFPSQKINDLRKHLKKEVLEKLTPKVDDFF